MHNANPYGHLLVNGQSPTDAQLGVLAGAPAEQVTALKKELLKEGLIKVSRDGVIFAPYLLKNRARLAADLTRENIPASIRREVFARDGKCCNYCGDTDGPFHLDHIFPWSRGGQNTLENLTVACASCNLRKSDMTPEEWRGVLQ